MNYIFPTIFIILVLIWTILYILSIISYFKNWIPQISTFNSDFKIMKKWLKKYNLKWKKILDMWSWIWKVTRFFEKTFWTKTYWCEIDFSNYIISKIINKLFWYNTKFQRWNYLKIDLKKYDYIYIYLFPKIINKAEKRIWKNAKKWTIIFSNAFKFLNHKPIEILIDNKWKEEVYIYKV
jgi:hypothetical protein